MACRSSDLKKSAQPPTHNLPALMALLPVMELLCCGLVVLLLQVLEECRDPESRFSLELYEIFWEPGIVYPVKGFLSFFFNHFFIILGFTQVSFIYHLFIIYLSFIYHLFIIYLLIAFGGIIVCCV